MDTDNLLNVDSISVSYPNRSQREKSRPVLKGVSFVLPAGRVLAVIGPNGAGKSTLIRAISGILPLQTGRIEVMGQDMNQLSAMERAQRMAVVPQARQMPPAFTAWETVLLGRTPYLNWLGQMAEKDISAARQAMVRTQTLDLMERRVGELSGGEQQRLLLARALAQSTSILLLDEPTTHLDIQHQVDLLQQISELAHRDGLAVLIVMHDLNIVSSYADEVLLLVEGKVEVIGPPRDVLTPEFLSRAYHIPLRVFSLEQGGQRIIIPDS
jgi:iron complex transport system ATP-binding protein